MFQRTTEALWKHCTTRITDNIVIKVLKWNKNHQHSWKTGHVCTLTLKQQQNGSPFRVISLFLLSHIHKWADDDVIKSIQSACCLPVGVAPVMVFWDLAAFCSSELYFSSAGSVVSICRWCSWYWGCPALDIFFCASSSPCLFISRLCVKFTCFRALCFSLPVLFWWHLASCAVCTLVWVCLITWCVCMCLCPLLLSAGPFVVVCLSACLFLFLGYLFRFCPMEGFCLRFLPVCRAHVFGSKRCPPHCYWTG